jgi:aspartyl-tRNA(Asn)/glutamyl-tRNA(Gln) amidotransferase subunit B
MEMALKAEIHRQIEEYLNHPNVPHDQLILQATYRWDPEKKETVLMRRKETADDYRYFPEPDLVPIILTDAYIEEMRQTLPELPLQRERRYVKNLDLSRHQAFALTSDKALADYFEKAFKMSSNARSVANWLLVEFAGRLKDSGETILSIGIKPEHVGTLVNLIDQGKITGRIAKSVADEMVARPGIDPAAIVAENPDYQPLNDQAEIERYVDKVLIENTQSIADYKAGRDKAFAFLVGQVMKLCRGKASPQLVNELLKDRIEKMKI